MQKLNLPEYKFRIKKDGSKFLIFDSIRKQYVVITPEEWVRQNFIEYLSDEKGYPKSLMAVEKKVSVNGQLQRFDLLVHDRKANPLLMAEFKAQTVKITQTAFDQVVRYNMALKVKFIVVSNGLDHFVCQIDYENGSYRFLKEVPMFG